MPFSTNLRIAVFKEETVPGTAEFDLSSTHPLDADFDLRIRDPQITPNYAIDDEASKFATGDHGEDPGIIGATDAQITFGIKIPWGGDVTTFPNATKAMQMAGLVEVSYTTVGRAWQPKKSADTQTFTAAYYFISTDGTPVGYGVLLKGCKAECTIGSDGVGAPLMAQYTVTGALADMLDIANGDIPVLTGADSTLAERALSVPVSIGGVTQCMTSWSLAFGNEISPYDCMSEATGHKYFYISKRAPRLTVNPTIQTVATEDIDAIVRGETSRTVTLQYDTNHFKVTCPRTQLFNIGVDQRDGIDSWGQTYKLLRNNLGAGKADSDLDDEVTFELLFGARA